MRALPRGSVDTVAADDPLSRFVEDIGLALLLLASMDSEDTEVRR